MTDQDRFVPILDRKMNVLTTNQRSIGIRLASAAICIVFVLTVRFAYRDVIVASGVFAYRGVFWNEVSPLHSASFVLLAVLPIFWLPIRVRQPSDIVALILYMMVFVPTAVMMPHLSSTPISIQLGYVVCAMIGLTMIGAVGFLPPVIGLKTNITPFLSKLIFGIIFFGIMGILLGWGGIAVSSLDIVNVYTDRAEFSERQVQLGRLFAYSSVVSMYGLGPFLVGYGLVNKRWLIVAAAFILLSITFMTTTHKIAYLAIPSVLGVYFVLKLMPRAPAIGLFAGFIGLTLVCAAMDIFWFTDSQVPKLSWFFFFRIFANNGFLSAGYLDYFYDNEKVLFTQSFMRSFLSEPYTIPIPKLIGEYWTFNPDNNANANLWADAYANVSLIGIVGMSFALSVILWIVNSAYHNKSLAIGTLALVMPSLALANTGVHSAVLSGGLLATVVFGLFLPSAKTKLQPLETISGGDRSQKSDRS